MGVLRILSILVGTGRVQMRPDPRSRSGHVLMYHPMLHLAQLLAFREGLQGGQAQAQASVWKWCRTFLPVAIRRPHLTTLYYALLHLTALAHTLLHLMTLCYT